jgi:hypothetical protein
MKDIGFLLKAGLALALGGLFHFADRRQMAVIRALAIRSGFHYLGGSTAIPDVEWNAV